MGPVPMWETQVGKNQMKIWRRKQKYLILRNLNDCYYEKSIR